jgi:hypothetical protein
VRPVTNIVIKSYSNVELKMRWPCLVARADVKRIVFDSIALAASRIARRLRVTISAGRSAVGIVVIASLRTLVVVVLLSNFYGASARG